MKENKNKEELVSLNETFSELDLQKLEDRLETDPLAVSGLLNLTSSEFSNSDFCWDYKCQGGMECSGYW